MVWHFTDRRGGVSQGPFRWLNLSASVGDDPDHVALNRRRTIEQI
ncbi:MAG: laccase domain-containing protein, partial [Bacillota bacterium]